jgi:hypothetical protein
MLAETKLLVRKGPVSKKGHLAIYNKRINSPVRAIVKAVLIIIEHQLTRNIDYQSGCRNNIRGMQSDNDVDSSTLSNIHSHT